MAKMNRMPEEERPREKALNQGIDSLSDSELIALLIRCGTHGRSAVEVGSDLLEASGGTGGLLRMNIQDMMKVRGISQVKALEIKAAIALSERASFSKVRGQDIMSSPEAVYHWCRKKLGNRLQEEVMVLYLDGGNHVIRASTLFRGTGDQSTVSPREILKEGLLCSAMSMMIVHNHPGGCLKPSSADLSMTQRLMYDADMIGIKIIDHLIVTAEGVFSMRREGILERMWMESRHAGC